MSQDWATRFTEEALTRINKYIVDNPGYTMEGVEQPGQGSTNRVFFANFAGNTHVFKYFCNEERKQRESFAFRHWQKTGLIPELIWDDDPRLIIMSHIPGNWLSETEELYGESEWQKACFSAGKAIGSLTQVSLSRTDREYFDSSFYEFGSLENYLVRLLELGRSIHAKDPDFQDSFWKESLDFINHQLDNILSQPRILYHQDVSNLHVIEGKFSGFFDLEMCRAGCEAMQLASAFGMLQERKEGWQEFRKGWESATGKKLTTDDLNAARAGNHLLWWRVISRYMSYDGTPESGFSWASPADPVECRTNIDAVDNLVKGR